MLTSHLLRYVTLPKPMSLVSTVWNNHSELFGGCYLGSTLEYWWYLTLSTQSANILALGLYMCSAMPQYIGMGVFTCVSSKAKWAFGVNPFLFSSNMCGPHFSTYITRREDGRGGAGIQGRKTGHSGKVTWRATVLHQLNFSDQLIKSTQAIVHYNLYLSINGLGLTNSTRCPWLFFHQ